MVVFDRHSSFCDFRREMPRARFVGLLCFLIAGVGYANDITHELPAKRSLTDLFFSNSSHKAFSQTSTQADSAATDHTTIFPSIDSSSGTGTNSSLALTADSTANPSVGFSVDSSAMDLFVTSGLQELVAQIPASTASSFEAALKAQQLPDLFTEMDQNDIRKAVDNAFKLDTFNNYLIKELSNGMSMQSREFMLTWYTSPLGIRVKQAEIDNSLLTDHERFDNFQIFLQHYPPATKRLELVEKLDTTLKSTESALDMMSSIQIAFNLSLTRFMPKEQRLSRQQIQNMALQSQKELLPHYQKKTKDVLLFTYQALNNEDLKLLNKTLATDAGQEFVLAINNGIKKGMFAASLDLGDELGMLLDLLPENSGI